MEINAMKTLVLFLFLFTAAGVFAFDSAPTVISVEPTFANPVTYQIDSTVNPNGPVTTVWVRYSTSDPGECNDSFGTLAPPGSFPSSGNTPLTFRTWIGSITTGTTYYVCAIASNSFGTSFGSVVSFVARGPMIAGVVSYANAIGSPSPRFVSNVDIRVDGQFSTTTNLAGYYSMAGSWPTSQFLVYCTKDGGVNGITSFDAALIAKHVAGIVPLTGYQSVVADVSGDGSISSFDSALVARYATGLSGVGRTGLWKFGPVSRTYFGLSSDRLDQDYAAYLMGEVSGNWINTP